MPKVLKWVACAAVAAGLTLVPSSSYSYPADHDVQYSDGASGYSDEVALIELGIRAAIRLPNKSWAEYSPDAFPDDGPGGSGWGGEVFNITDLAPDGQRVAVHWVVVDGLKRGLCINVSGHTPAMGEEYRFCRLPDIPEGRTIKFRTGACNATATGCDDYQDWTWTSGDSPDGYQVNGWVDFTDDADYDLGNGCDERDRERDC